MLTSELIRKIRKIEIYTNRLVNDRLAGAYHSVFKGRGMAFSEVRRYLTGDDVRSAEEGQDARPARRVRDPDLPPAGPKDRSRAGDRVPRARDAKEIGRLPALRLRRRRVRQGAADRARTARPRAGGHRRPDGGG